MPRAKRAEVLEEEPPLDRAEESPDNGGISEAELAIERSVAKRMGWIDREAWEAAGRDPAKHTSAHDYLEKTPQEFARLKEQRDRAASAAAEAIEEDRRQRRAELESRLRTEDDPEKRVETARSLAEVSGPSPETKAWIADNPWFEADAGAKAEVVRVCNFLAAQGMSHADQLEGAKRSVQAKFPHLFPEPQRSVSTETLPARLSEVRRPAAQAGTRANVTAPREKGWADIPARHRQQAEAALGRYWTRPTSRENYAKAYWRDVAAGNIEQ